MESPNLSNYYWKTRARDGAATCWVLYSYEDAAVAIIDENEYGYRYRVGPNLLSSNVFYSSLEIAKQRAEDKLREVISDLNRPAPPLPAPTRWERIKSAVGIVTRK